MVLYSSVILYQFHVIEKTPVFIITKTSPPPPNLSKISENPNPSFPPPTPSIWRLGVFNVDF